MKARNIATTSLVSISTCAVALLVASTKPAPALAKLGGRPESILVAGSANVDTFLPVARFPSPGENLTLLPGRDPEVDVPGGKGCNQAIAASRISKRGGGGGGGTTTRAVSFLGQFGNDPAAEVLRSALAEAGVEASLCGS